MTKPLVITLAQAQQCALMGKPGNWNGHARCPLATIPDGILRQARAFFAHGIDEPNERTRMQVKAIDLVLADREANSPQGSLAL